MAALPPLLRGFSSSPTGTAGASGGLVAVVPGSASGACWATTCRVEAIPSGAKPSRVMAAQALVTLAHFCTPPLFPRGAKESPECGRAADNASCSACHHPHDSLSRVRGSVSGGPQHPSPDSPTSHEPSSEKPRAEVQRGKATFPGTVGRSHHNCDNRGHRNTWLLGDAMYRGLCVISLSLRENPIRWALLSYPFHGIGKPKAGSSGVICLRSHSWWAVGPGFEPKSVIWTSRARGSTPHYSSMGSYYLCGPDELFSTVTKQNKKNPTTPWDGAYLH